MIEQRWPTQDPPLSDLANFFLSQKSYFVLPNFCHCDFCSTLFLQLLLLQLLMAFNKTNVYKMYISQYFHNHLCVFFPFLSICVWYGPISVLWTFSTSKLDFLKLWGVLIPKGFSKQSTLISWVGTSVDLCCTFALLLKIFLHK